MRLNSPAATRLINESLRKYNPHISLDDFGYEIIAYVTPFDFYNHSGRKVTNFIFPTIPSAVRYMSEQFPGIELYDIVMCNAPVDVPAPYVYY